MDTVKIPKGSVRMVAHQGCHVAEQWNSCPAFVAAGNRSYWGIETDIHVTADGKFVVIHEACNHDTWSDSKENLPTPLTVYTPEEIEDFMRQAGFKDIQIYRGEGENICVIGTK